MIELIVVVVVVILAPLVALSLPAAREATRRTHCVYNLKQLGLASLNYESAASVLPPGSFGSLSDRRPGFTFGLGVLVRVLPIGDGAATFNAANFVLPTLNPANGTLAATGLNLLWCPSDHHVTESHRPDSDYEVPVGSNIFQWHTSFGGCQGLWTIQILPNDSDSTAQVANMNGVIFASSVVRLAKITDGTSTTVLFAETPHGKIPPDRDHRPQSRWRNSGTPPDSMVTAYYPSTAPSRGSPTSTGTAATGS